MKKKALVICLCLILVFIFAVTINIQLVGADSGFDSSYDSDGDSDGGALFYLIYLCFEYPALGIGVLAVIIINYISNKSKSNKIIKNGLNSKMELLNVTIFPKEKQLEIEAFNIYKQIQFAWMNFDEETIRKYTTDEMYNMYLMQLDTLKVKSQKNIMYDIKYISSKIISKFEENGQEAITMNMQVSCYDFIINTKNNKVVRGESSKLNYYSYELTFVRKKENKNTTICPKCGAPINVNNSGICEYCKSTIVNNNYTLIMSKKKMLSQK